MDKIVIKFLADILYLKGIICFEEFDDIMNSKSLVDLDCIVDKIIKGEYNAYRQGEGYVRSARIAIRRGK